MTLFQVRVNREAGSGFGNLGDHSVKIGVGSRFDQISSPGCVRLRLFK